MMLHGPSSLQHPTLAPRCPLALAPRKSPHPNIVSHSRVQAPALGRDEVVLKQHQPVVEAGAQHEVLPNFLLLGMQELNSPSGPKNTSPSLPGCHRPQCHLGHSLLIQPQPWDSRSILHAAEQSLKLGGSLRACPRI